MVLKTTSESNILYLHFVDLNITKRTQSDATTFFANLVDGRTCCNNYFTNDLNIARRTVKCYKIFRMIQILRMEEPVTKRTVPYDNYFANDLNIAKRTVQCNNVFYSNDLDLADGRTCCKNDSPMQQLFCK